jgi:uncharacterized protein with PIN domain
MSDTEATDLDGPFLLDAMLGKLAVYLRMCGHDAAYALDRGVEADDDLLGLVRAEGRTLLTRDAELAGRAGDRGHLLTSRDVTDQLRELRDAGLALELADRPARCGNCNGPLARAADAPAHAPEDRPVWVCPDCGQAFWRGSHWADVRGTLAEL